jgi:hypothetical protein
MNLQEEIAKVARELYEKSGRIEGRDRENWLDAEKIVLARHASQEMEEPEGEESIVAEAGVTEEVEVTEQRQPSKEEEETTVIEETEVWPIIAKKGETRTAGPAEKPMPAKKGGPRKKAAVKGKKETSKKTRGR